MRLPLIALALAAAVVAMARQPPTEGSAIRSVHLRMMFLQTSARMFASAPALGVGVGRFHERSNEFMPEDLRVVYPHENAHNYFAQQFAELGVLGGAAFIWLVVAALQQGWRATTAAAREARGPAVGLLAGAAAYLLTCITGHPLLVPEAALPFWATLGAVVASAGDGRQLDLALTRRAITTLPVLALGAGIVAGMWKYAHTSSRPPERGFYEEGIGPGGETIRWMTRHAVTYGASAPGILRLELRAPDLPQPRPFSVEIAVGGRVVDRLELPPGEWVTHEIVERTRAMTPFRRIDVCVRPMPVMVRQMRWFGPGSR